MVPPFEDGISLACRIASIGGSASYVESVCQSVARLTPYQATVAHGGQGRLRRRPVDSFFPVLLLRAGDVGGKRSDHRHERMTMQTLPGSSLEVVKTEFFFHLLVSLLA